MIKRGENAIYRKIVVKIPKALVLVCERVWTNTFLQAQENASPVEAGTVIWDLKRTLANLRESYLDRSSAQRAASSRGRGRGVGIVCVAGRCERLEYALPSI